MGLDVSVMRTGKYIDLGQMYTIMSTVVNGMDWYLGDDKSQRKDAYARMKEKAILLSREKVLADAKVNERTRKFLEEMDKTQFGIYLSWVVSSIKDYVDENNTHLEFDWDLLPGMTILDSCSWNLKDIFEQCSNGKSYPDGDFVVEIDQAKVCELKKKWKAKSFKMKIAKWVGWFLPDTGRRIAEDCMKELGLNDYWIEIDDLLYYKREIEKVAKFIQPSSDRLWLVSSY